MSSSSASLVTSSTRKGTAYLEVVPYRGKVRIQRTKAGRCLNKFWTVWLRQLILEKTDLKHSFAVELRGTSVLVSSRTTQQGLIETVRSLCEEIVPIPNPPITRIDSCTSKAGASWKIEGDFDIDACLESLDLPGKARVHGDWGGCRITRDQKNVFRISELCLMVELHVALYCRS